MSPIYRCALSSLAATLPRRFIDAYRFDDPLDEAPELGEHEEASDHQAETLDERQACKGKQKQKSEIPPEDLNEGESISLSIFPSLVFATRCCQGSLLLLPTFHLC